jgi:hypothetical protein
MISFHSHAVRSGSCAASNAKLEGKRMGSDGTGHTYRHSALYAQQATMRQFTSREKRCISVSTTRAIRTRDREAKKFESLKDFEVRDIHKKKPWDKWIGSFNPIGTAICPKHEMKVETSPDRVIRVSVRSVPAFSGQLVGL